MLCLHDSLRYDDPSVQRLLRAVEDTHTLTALILAVWSLARVLAIPLVEEVLAERARHTTLSPRCPASWPYPLSKRCWPTAPGTRHYGPAARSVGHAYAVKALRSAR